MIDFHHKKYTVTFDLRFFSCLEFFCEEMRLFMWFGFLLHFGVSLGRQRNELRDCFTASLLNGSLVFFCQVKNHQRDLDGFIGQSDKLQRVGIYIFLQ